MTTTKKKTLNKAATVEVVNSLEWILEPVYGQTLASTTHTWTTKDGSYQVVRFESPGSLPTFGAQYRRTPTCWDVFENDRKLGPGYPRYYKSLEEALVSAELFHLWKTKKTTIHSNLADVISHAHKLGLDGSRVRTAREPGTIKEAGTEARAKPARRSEGKMGCLEACYLVLCEEDRDMDCKELVKLMSERGYWSSPGGATPDRTLNAAISVTMRKGDKRFKKVGRGLYSRGE